MSIFMIIFINIDIIQSSWYNHHMSSTRDRVLQALLTHPRITIDELADEVGINPISIRHHIASLQAEGLVIDRRRAAWCRSSSLCIFLNRSRG